jgi:Flp pilus assembly protein TadD/arylsulfatase A-like enzyme
MNDRLARRVAIVGWDAADWKVIHPLLDQGLMPNLQKLIERGVMGNIATLEPCMSPILWTSIATGKTADRHGVTGFLEPDPFTGRVRPVASTSRRAKAVWNICSQSGMRSVVVNWFATHPAEPIAGAMVSKEYATIRAPFGAEWPLPAETIHPPHVTETLASLRVHSAELTGDDLLLFIPELARVDQRQDKRPATLAAILAENISVQAAATWLIENEEWDLLAVYFDAPDRAGHHFMEMRAPRMDHVSEADFEIYCKVIDGVYCYQDLMLGRLVQLAGPETAILVVSDHGFHSDHLRPVGAASFQPETPALWHRSSGIFCLAGPGIRHDELVYGATLLDVAPTVLTLLGLPVAADMPGRVLAEAFELPPAADRIPSWEDVPGDAGLHPEEYRSDPADAFEAIQQLRDLGYVDPLAESEEAAVKLALLHQKLNLARVHISAGRGGEAIPLMEEVVRMEPAELLFQLLLAQAYFLAGRAEECRRIAEAVLRQDPDRPGASALQGTLALMEGKLEEGLAGLLAAERSSRPVPGLRVVIGNVYLKLKRWADAERAFRGVLAVDPDSPAAHSGLASALIGQGDPEAAADAAADSVALRFDQPAAHFSLGVALAQTGRRDRAIQAFQTCLKLYPEFAEARRWLEKLGDADAVHGLAPAGR